MKKSKKKKAVYNMTLEQIEQMKKEATNKAANLLIVQTLYIALMVVRDKYGFGKKRLGDFAEYYIELVDSMNKDYISLDDMMTAIYEETGVRIERR